jgi:hypothetical protein
MITVGSLWAMDEKPTSARMQIPSLPSWRLLSLHIDNIYLQALAVRVKLINGPYIYKLSDTQRANALTPSTGSISVIKWLTALAQM